MIEINGRLEFKHDMNLTLNAKHIFIRAGELVIGNETHRFNNSATIVLHGKKDEQHIVYDGAIEAGNKLIANVGKISMYGKPRPTFSRLRAPCLRGDSSIMVDPEFDL